MTHLPTEPTSLFTAAYGTLVLGQTDSSSELWLMEPPDPTTLISAEILWRIHWDKGGHPAVTLERPASGHGSTGHSAGEYDCHAPPGDLCHYGSILRIKTVQQTLVYVIDEYNSLRNAWAAHWPD